MFFSSKSHRAASGGRGRRDYVVGDVHGRLDLLDDLIGQIEADLAQPEHLLSMAARHLDLTRPVAVVLSNVLGHLPTLEQASSIVHRLLGPLPAGSHLVVADSTDVIDHRAVTAAVKLWNDAGVLAYQLRSPAEIEQVAQDVAARYVAAYGGAAGLCAAAKRQGKRLASLPVGLRAAFAGRARCLRR